MAFFKVISVPSTEPITLSEAKNYLKVEDSYTDDDTLITAIITSVRQYIETYLSTALITQTIEEKWDYFEVRDYQLRQNFNLGVNPVQSVTSITYIDTDGDSQTWSASEYVVDTHRPVARIGLKNGYTWPSIQDEINALTVTYVAGYGNSGSSVPGNILQAMRYLIATYYENRTDHLATLPTASRVILDNIKYGMGIGF